MYFGYNSQLLQAKSKQKGYHMWISTDSSAVLWVLSVAALWPSTVFATMFLYEMLGFLRTRSVSSSSLSIDPLISDSLRSDRMFVILNSTEVFHIFSSLFCSEFQKIFLNEFRAKSPLLTKLI